MKERIVMIGSYHEHKRLLIMNIVNHLGPISRTKLAELTGYQPAAITAITKQLIDECILLEVGSYSSGHGRKRALLQLNKGHLCAVSISFSATAITFIVAQFDGTILGREETDFPDDMSDSALLEIIREKTNEILEKYRERNLIGIGICTPSNDPISRPFAAIRTDYRRFSYWIREVLVPELSRQLPVPVSLFYDVTLAIWAEQNFGSAKGINDFICVELSNGLGCSICCNGKAVTGVNGIAGEIGHTVIGERTSSSHMCYCGKPGCVECSSVLPQLLGAIGTALKSDVISELRSSYKKNGEISVAEIRAAVENGDQMCRYYVRESAVKLGTAIANAVMLLNPAMVILYGSMLELGDYFIEHLENGILDNVIQSVRKEIKILVSKDLERKLPLGGISEIFSLYLKKDDFSWVYRLPASDEVTE